MSSYFSKFDFLLISFGIIIVIFGGALFYSHKPLRSRARGVFQDVGVLATPTPLSFQTQPAVRSDRITARRLLVNELHQSLIQKNYTEAARLNAILSQEAFERAYRTINAWATLQDPSTGLIPYAVPSPYAWWDSEDVASDNFSHLLIGSYYLDQENFDNWLKILRKEYELCGALACRVDLKTDQVITEDMDTQIFGTSEYAKDGLLAVVERLGDGPWLDRMITGVDAIMKVSAVQTPFGIIPSNGTEVNGEMLQILSRLYWMTDDEQYVTMAERIADAYLFEILPHNNYLPADYWNFEQKKPLEADTRFRPAVEGQVQQFRFADHGSEIIPGLAELYILERIKNRPKAVEYREPLQNFFDHIIDTGRTEDGLWYRSIDVNTGEPFEPGVVDTWGYILIGLHSFDLAENSERYTEEIKRTMLTVANQKSIEWEKDYQDGYADSIESMLYLLPWFDLSEGHYWVDDEIEVMFLKQQPDGFVEGWYLDGNFVRTALLYGQYKTQGLMVDQWSSNVRLGAAYEKPTDTLHIYLIADEPWSGALKFDTQRHSDTWNLPIEYPRLNSAPEWYTVDMTATYIITNLGTGEIKTFLGAELAAGIPLDLKGNPLQFTVQKQ